VIVMTGIGVIALAGVVVNNNIVLIDTYVHLRSEGWDKLDAMLETCRERVRPVVLTAVTAILGVLPIAFGVNLELISHETTYRRAVDAMVDRAVERHRLRTGVLDHADAGGDAIPLDDCHPLERQQGDRLVATHEGACRSWEQARSASSQGRSCRIASLCP
jgi:hypothetical protein